MKAAAFTWPKLRPEWFRGRYIACLLVLAFSVQSYITQTHIDGWVWATGERTAIGMLAQAPSDTKAPAGHHRTDCPFCQAVTHAGVFFAPALPVWILPVVWIGQASLPARAPTGGRTAAHIWQSRAPPQR